MAVGRITGPLLSKNLLRNGVDLSFETDLLYLDVTNGRIGVKTTNPAYALDVNGTGRFNEVIVPLIDSVSGNLVLQASSTSSNIIQLQNNTEVNANFVVNGGTQLGNSSTDVLSIISNIVSDLLPQTSSTYNIGSVDQSWNEGYFNNIIATAFAGFPGQEVNIGIPATGVTGKDINVGPILNPTVNINGPIRVWGDNPLGTAPVVSNTLYVSNDGSDTNDGRANDPTRACRTISGAVRSPFYKSGTSIKVAPGRYYENNPIPLKPHTSVIGSDLRTTFIEPINKTQDLFHVQSGCYLAQMQFSNGQSGLMPGLGYTPGTNRGAYCAAFPPQYGDQKIDVFYSPYIQNCTNQSGPWLQDGTLFRPNQTVQIPEAVGTATWIINTTTLIVTVSEGTLAVGQSINIGPDPQDYINARTLLLANKPFIQEQVIAYINQNNTGFTYNQAICYRDIGIVVENVAYDVAFGGNQKTVESGLAYWNGVVSVIANEITTTTNAFTYFATIAQDILNNTSATNLLSVYQTAPQIINTALTNGITAGPLVTKLVGVINDIVQNGPGVAPPIQPSNGPNWGAVSAEVLLQTNRRFIQNEVINWINDTYPGFTYREDLCYRDTGLIIDAVSQDIVLNANAKSIEAGKTYWTGNINAVATEVTQTVAALNHAKSLALDIINNNTASVSTFVFNSVRCYRDTGLIVDALAQDLLFDGNSQSTFAGIQYWNHASYVGQVGAELTQTIDAINFVSSLAQTIIVNSTGTTYQNTVTQNISLPAASVSEKPVVANLFSTVTNILSSGTVGVTDKIVPNGIAISGDINDQTAYAILQANKEYLQAETVAYINAVNTGFSYDQAICYRDVGYIVDSVSFDILYGGNKQSIQSGVYYWGYNNVSTSLPKEQNASTLAYQYMKTLAENIILGKTITTTYQNTVTQYTLLPVGTAIEVNKVSTNIDLITNIINQGPTIVPDKTPIGLTQSNNRFVNHAAALLNVNRTFIQAEVCAYVQSTVNDQVFLPFYDKGSQATLDIVRNFDVIINIIQNGPKVAPETTQGNGIFLLTGLSNDDVKTAPVITSITTVSSGVYQVDISQSTIGYGDDQPLYFGETLIYPKLDNDVPDRWQQRRVNSIGSMGGALVDGGVVSDRSPITSFVFDAFTQVNQGGVGIHITNNGYAQLVSVFTIFCSTAVLVENGGIASITNSNANFGDQCLVSKGYGKREFSGYIYNPPVLPYFPIGQYPRGGTVEVYVADPELRPHIGLVMEVTPPSGFINNYGLPGFLTGNTTVGILITGTITITGIDNTGIVIGQTFHVVDQYGSKTDSLGNPYVTTGTIVADVNYQSVTLNLPLNSGGGDPNNSNYFNLYTCGNAYYTVLSSVVGPDPITPGTRLIPNDIISTCTNGMLYINSLTSGIITNTPITPLQTGTVQVIDVTLQGGSGAQSFIDNSINLITSIVTNGPSSAPTITRTGTIPSGAGSAAALLEKNKAFIAAEVVAYMNSITTTTYNTTSSLRDVGLLIDAVSYDLATGGNYNSVIAGQSFYATTGTHHIVSIEESIADPGLFPDGAVTTFYQRSYQSASGYLFEYVGAGANYGALPQRGVADPVQSKEVVQLNNGKVFFTSTDQNGDFRIGPGLVISQATGVLSGRTFTKSLFANLTPFILAIEGI